MAEAKNDKQPVMEKPPEAPAPTPGTVRIKPTGKDQGDFVEIDEKDFDEKKHQKVEDKKK